MPDTPDHNRRTFPRKLYDMLEQEPEEIVGWLKDGNSFRINDETAFCEHVLPKHYAHKKMASFQSWVGKSGFRTPARLAGIAGIPAFRLALCLAAPGFRRNIEPRARGALAALRVRASWYVWPADTTIAFGLLSISTTSCTR